MGLLSEILKVKNTSADCSKLQELIMDKTAGDMDSNGHIFVTKGEAAHYPTFICNIETLQRLGHNFRPERITHNIWVGLNTDSNKPCPLTAQSKCGTFLLLKLFDILEAAKFVFYKANCIVATDLDKANPGFFDDSAYALELNHEGKNKIVATSYTQPYASPIFLEELRKFAKGTDFAITTAHSTLISHLKATKALKVASAGLSVGYFNHAEDLEHIVESELMRTLGLCISIGRGLKTQFTHTEAIQLKGQNECSHPNCTRPLVQDEIYYCGAHFYQMKRARLMCRTCGDDLYTESQFYHKICNRHMPSE